MLCARILGTTGVIGFATDASQLKRQIRGYPVQVAIDTVYGQTLVSTAVSGANDDVRSSR